MNLLLRVVSLIALLSGPLMAEPLHYDLDPTRSRVGFVATFGSDRITGTIPIATAEVQLDFDRAASSFVRVVLDATGARASFPFATQAMTGPKVLAVSQFPTLTFESRSLAVGTTSATLTGDLTIRGVTRPVMLEAQVFRQRGTQAGDRSRMSVRLNGTVRRSEFGATGWADMVGDVVELDILVRIDQIRG
ncbi:YceI family protein [Shimia biformata]|uniref:YceI family protein n=1 Tax=Shimia biformata TaxID=1294299 RepID=UPI0019512BDD|nr:YceI family protein [Shimia biformata]